MSSVNELYGITLICLVLLSVVAGLDRTALAQSMVCRPLVCGALCGLVLDNYGAGITIGCAMELLWLMRLPVGATISPDDTQATIAAVILFCALSRDLGAGLPASLFMTLLIFLAALFAPVGRLVDIGARQINGWLCHQFETGSSEYAFNVNGYRAGLFSLIGLFNFALAALFSQAMIFLAILASVAVIAPLLADMPWRYSEVPVYAIVLVGIASVYACIKVRYGGILFVAGFGATLMFLLV